MARDKKGYRTVVVGCGNMGALLEHDPDRPKPATHARAAEMNGRTKLTALVDRDAKRLALAGKLFPNAARYADANECFRNERPDIVVIATEPASHYSIIKQAVAADVSIVICEKPLTLSLAQARKIETLVKKNGTTFVLNYHRRFFRLFDDIRVAIAKGRLGRIQQVTCYYSNGLHANGSHSVDAALFLLQDTVEYVSGHVNTHNRTHPSGDRNVDGMLVTKRGTTIALQSLDQDCYCINTLQIFGEKGSVVVDEFGFRARWYKVGPSMFANLKKIGVKSTRRHQKTKSATAGVLTHAIDCFSRTACPKSSAASGRMLVEILTALCRSADQGGRAQSLLPKTTGRQAL